MRRTIEDPKGFGAAQKGQIYEVLFRSDGEIAISVPTEESGVPEEFVVHPDDIQDPDLPVSRTFSMDVRVKDNQFAETKGVGQGVKLSVEVDCPALSLFILEKALEDTVTIGLREAGLGQIGGISTHTTVDPWPLEDST